MGGRKGSRKLPTSFRFTDEASELLDTIARANGLEKSAVIEQAIREMARRQGLWTDPISTIDQAARDAGMSVPAWLAKVAAEAAERQLREAEERREFAAGAARKRS